MKLKKLIDKLNRLNVPDSAKIIVEPYGDCLKMLCISSVLDYSRGFKEIIGQQISMRVFTLEDNLSRAKDKTVGDLRKLIKKIKFPAKDIPVTFDDNEIDDISIGAHSIAFWAE
jgi:hypothetical protein